MITISQGWILDNGELCELFKCSSQGGILSHIKNSKTE